MHSMRVLVVEDEKKLASFLRKGLVEESFVVDLVYDGSEAIDHILGGAYDAIILDIMLPQRDGLSILREMRERHINTPVLLLSARGNVNERVEGLNIGADDYLPKPFSIMEVIARIRALLRRASGEHSTVMQVADLSLNVVTREAMRAGHKVDLTNREFALLEVLMMTAPRPVSKAVIIERVWNQFFDSQTNVVNVYMNHLRSKIDLPGLIPIVQTVRGVGFALRKPDP